MKNLRRILVFGLMIEVVVAAYFVSVRVSRPAPPDIDISRLDPLTAADLDVLRHNVADAGKARDWRELAEACLGNGYYIAAEQCFRQSFEMNPGDLQSEYGRGFCLERIGRTKAAIPILMKTAKTANSELARTCWYQIGRCFLRQEDHREAEKSFRRIVGFPPAAYQLAKILIRTDRAAEAQTIVREQLAGTPNSLKFIQLNMHAAEVLDDTDLVARMRDREDRAEYQLILEYNQNFISMFAGRYGLSRLLSTAIRLKTEGTLNDRQAVLQKALKIIRANGLWQYRSVLLAAAHVELGLGNFEATKSLIEEIEQYTQTGTDVLDLQALLAEAEGDHDVAAKVWQRAVKQKPTPEIYLALFESKASMDESTRQGYKANAEFRQAIDALRINNIEKAMALLNTASEALSESDLLFYYLGECHRILGETDKAREAYLSCLKLNPDFGRCLLRIENIEN